MEEEKVKMLFQPVMVTGRPRSHKFKGFGIAVGFVGFWGSTYKYVEGWKNHESVIVWDSKTNILNYV